MVPAYTTGTRTIHLSFDKITHGAFPIDYLDLDLDRRLLSFLDIFLGYFLSKSWAISVTKAES